MPTGGPPACFVSSTCYDLSQVRQDMLEFLRTVGLEPLLSEEGSFPVRSHATTLDACLEAIDLRADVLVLIVGNRYGHRPDGGLSVTNREYLQAKAKGIPIIAFVGRQILPLVPVWKANPNADFRGVVDDPSVLRFVSELRESSDCWMFEFSSAQDIVATLRAQLANLFMEGLTAMRAMRAAPLPAGLADITGDSFRLVATKPPFWEHRLFVSVLASHLAQNADLRRDVEHGIVWRPGEYVEHPLTWISQHVQGVLMLTRTADRVVNTLLADPATFGPTGVAGDPELIVHGARSVGRLHRGALEWSLELHSARTDPEYATLLAHAAAMARPLYTGIEAFAADLQQGITKAERAPPDTPLRLTIELIFAAPDLTAFQLELARVQERKGR